MLLSLAPTATLNASPSLLEQAALPTLSTPASLLWFVVICVSAFAVTWIVAHRLRLKRQNYIAALAVVTGLLSWGYLNEADVSAANLLSHNWVWGVIVAPFAAAFSAFGMTRLPATNRRTGRSLVGALAWEGGVYGVAEGVLLSALPAVVVWQMTQSLEGDGGIGIISRWLLPLGASLVVIVVHHLGYGEYGKRELALITLGCGLLTIGLLVTGSVLAAVIGHVIMHVASVLHGAELPPHVAESLPGQRRSTTIGMPLPSTSPASLREGTPVVGRRAPSSRPR